MDELVKPGMMMLKPHIKPEKRYHHTFGVMFKLGIIATEKSIANITSVHNQISCQGDSVSQTAGAVNEIASNIESLERMIANQSQGVSNASSAVEEMIGNIDSVTSTVEKMVGSFNILSDSARDGYQKQSDVNEMILKIESDSELLL